MKNLVILGGANGAGKTTAAVALLPSQFVIREFVNADEIARGLSPFDPEPAAFAAGRLMIGRIRELAKGGESFAFETTCAGVGHARLVRSCKALGYRVNLFFLWLHAPELAVARVANRVRLGGHGLSTDVIVRRYQAGLRNMRHVYLPLADVGLIYDNSEQGRVLIAESEPSGIVVHDDQKWASIEEAARWTT